MTAPGRGGSGRGDQTIPNSVRGAVLVGLAVIVGIIGLQILDDSGTGSSITIATSDDVTDHDHDGNRDNGEAARQAR